MANDTLGALNSWRSTSFSPLAAAIVERIEGA
jgi:hypothetical protein